MELNGLKAGPGLRSIKHVSFKWWRLCRMRMASDGRWDLTSHRHRAANDDDNENWTLSSERQKIKLSRENMNCFRHRHRHHHQSSAHQQFKFLASISWRIFPMRKIFPSSDCCRRVVYPARHRLMKRFLVIVLHSFHFRFFYCRFFSFFLFLPLGSHAAAKQKKRRESSWSVMSFHLTSTSHLLLSFRPGIHTFFSVALLSLVVGEMDGNFYSRAAVKWQWRWWWKKNAEICCSSGVLFE